MIPLHRDAFVLISVLKTQPESCDEIAALVSEMAHTCLKNQPGYLAAAVHSSLDGERVVNYTQWESDKAYFDSVARAGADRGAQKIGRILDHLATVEPRHYHLVKRIPKSVMPTIAMGTDTATLISIFQLYDPRNQEKLLTLIAQTAELLDSRHCGIVSANLHTSTDGRAVANYTQWESIEAFDEAMRMDEMEKLLRTHVELSYPDAHLYEAVDVIPGTAQHERVAGCPSLSGTK